MPADRSANRASELEQERDEERPLDLPRESEFEFEWEAPRLRPLIRSICGEAQGIRRRLLTSRADARGGAIAYARKWLRRTSNRWPYDRLRDLTRRELDILAGCLYGVVSAMGEEPEPYRRLRSDIGRLLGVPAVRRAHETEPELEDEYSDEPYRWPTTRRFNPPPLRTIPAGPPQTFSPCRAIEDDFSRLVLAVDDLKSELRQRPSNPARVSNRADIVTALSRQIVARLQSLSYVQRGCTRQDMNLFASSVNVMRGGGADGATGSWPPASSATVQGPRRQARESLRHLLNWIRRAERNFPRI